MRLLCSHELGEVQPSCLACRRANRRTADARRAGPEDLPAHPRLRGSVIVDLPSSILEATAGHVHCTCPGVAAVADAGRRRVRWAKPTCHRTCSLVQPEAVLCCEMMGRDQTRMLICALASLVLILAGALFMDWYRAATAGFELNRLSIDLVAVRLCETAHVCARESVTSVRGMYPSLAAVTLWSSLGFAALVGFQAGARLLAGGALDAFTKLGYMLALMAMSLAVATAFLFGPEVPDVRMVATTWFDVALHRTWAPATLIVGLSIGFVAIYLAVARESSDSAAAYKPVSVDPSGTDRGRRVAIPFPVPPGEQTDFNLPAAQ